MKKVLLVTAFSLMISFCLSSQNKLVGKNQYSVGLGYGYNSNAGNDGIVFSNDYKYYLTNRFALNPGISFFQSINLFANLDNTGYKSHSGLLLNFSLDYVLLQRDDFSLALNVGPSFEIGDDTFTSMRSFSNGVLTGEQFENKRIFEPGLFGSVDLMWDMNNGKSRTLSIISNSQYGLIPISLGIVYKVGF